jgi:hypothetical protein
MSAHEVSARLEQLKGVAEEANVMQRALVAHLEQISDGLEGLSAQGFNPGRMGMAIALANETKNKAGENASRVFSIYQGIAEMI